MGHNGSDVCLDCRCGRRIFLNNWFERVVRDEFFDCANGNVNSSANPDVSQFSIFDEFPNTAFGPASSVSEFFD